MAQFNNNDVSITHHGVEVPLAGRPSFQIVQADTRGRIYSDTDDSPQAGYRAKALLRSYEASPITEEVAAILLMGVNDIVDGDEITADNLDSVMATTIDHAKTVAKVSAALGSASPAFRQAREEFWGFAKSLNSTPTRLLHAAQYAKSLRAYYNRAEGEVVTTDRYIFIDAKTNALQHHAYLTGNRELAKFGGLDGSEAIDAYYTVGLALHHWLASGRYVSQGFSNPDSIQTPRSEVVDFGDDTYRILRKLAKLAVMVRTYGAGNATMKQCLLDAAKKLPEVPAQQAKDYAELLPEVMQAFETNNFVRVKKYNMKLPAFGAAKASNGPTSLQAWVKIFKRAFPKAGFAGVSWLTSPDGFTALRATVKTGYRPTTIKFRGALDTELAFKYEAVDMASHAAKSIRSKVVDLDESFTGVVPDLVHALDGEAMRLMFFFLEELGVEGAHHIHDCVAVPARYRAEALEAFKRAHYAVYMASGYDYLAFIASQRVAELEASKPGSDASADELADWEAMLAAANKAVAASTSSRFVQRGKRRLTMAKLVDLIHPSAFAPE